MREGKPKVVVITGAAAGIGLGIARAFTSGGAQVVMADIDASTLDAAVSGLRDQGADAFGVPCDVRSSDSMASLREAALRRFGGVDVVCLNAGGPIPRSTLEVQAADWERVLAVNLFGVINGVQAFLPFLAAAGGGHINATSSMSGLVPFPPVVAYNVAKAGVIAYMETLAHELRTEGSPVRVSVLCPGEVATRAVENAMRLARLEGHNASPEELDQAVAAQRGLLRGGISPEEVGRALIRGIEEDRFWIFTHPQWVQGPLKQRHRAMVNDGSLADI